MAVRTVKRARPATLNVLETRVSGVEDLSLILCTRQVSIDPGLLGLGS